MGHKSQPQQLWEVLRLFPKTHYEEYHRNPKVDGQQEELLSETGNDPFQLTRNTVVRKNPIVVFWQSWWSSDHL